jgi:hypothetical protein
VSVFTQVAVRGRRALSARARTPLQRKPGRKRRRVGASQAFPSPASHLCRSPLAAPGISPASQSRRLHQQGGHVPLNLRNMTRTTIRRQSAAGGCLSAAAANTILRVINSSPQPSLINAPAPAGRWRRSWTRPSASATPPAPNAHVAACGDRDWRPPTLWDSAAAGGPAKLSGGRPYSHFACGPGWTRTVQQGLGLGMILGCGPGRQRAGPWEKS